MTAGARRQGAVATRLPARLDALPQESRPASRWSCQANLGLLALMRHYAVVVGYEPAPAAPSLRSEHHCAVPGDGAAHPSNAHLTVRAGAWRPRRDLPPGRWLATAEEPAALDAAVGFERVAPAADAQQVVAARWRAGPTASACRWAWATRCTPAATRPARG